MPVLLGLLDLLPAAVILLILGAVVLLIGLIKTAVDQIPGGVFVQPIKDAINSAASNIVAALTKGMAAVARPIANLWMTFANWADRMFTATVNAVEAHASAIQYALRVAIPSAIRFLQTQISSVENYLVARISSVESFLFRELSLVENYVLGVISSGISSLLRLISSVQAFLLGRLAAVETFLLGVVQTVQAALSGQLVAAVTALVQEMLGLNANTAATAAAEAALAQQNAVAQATQWAQGYTNNAVADLNTALNGAGALGIAGALPDIRALGKDLADILPGDLTGILPALGSLAAAKAIDIESAIGVLSTVGVTALEGLDKCAFPMCSKLGKLGEETASLLDGAILLGMIAFVAAAVEAPEETAKVVDEVMIEPLAAIGGDVIGFISSL